MMISNYANLFRITGYKEGLVRVVFMDQQADEDAEECCHVVMTVENADALQKAIAQQVAALKGNGEGK
jgi:hypothetical protein